MIHKACSLFLCGLLGASLSCPAADITWTNTGGGDWSGVSNWNPNQVPGLSDRAILPLSVTVTVAADATVGSLVFSNGTLSGTGNLTITNTMTWTAGTLTGAGITTLLPGGTLLITGSSTKLFAQRTINNAGTILWTGGDIWSGSGSSISNQPGGQIDVQGDQSWLYNLGGSMPVFNNAGTFQKSSGTGISVLGVLVNNDGAFTVQSGTVTLGNGGDSHGTFSVLSGATLNFGGGAMTLETNSTVSGNGALEFSSGPVQINGAYSVGGSTVVNGGIANFNSAAGTHDGSLSAGTLGGTGTLTVSGTLSWTGGGINGGGTNIIASGATLAVSGGTKLFAQETINNAGTILWTAGDIWSGSGATINNRPGGLFDLQGDQSWLYNLGGNLPVFNNSGTFQKSSGTGTSSISAIASNAGNLSLLSGTLNLNGPSFANQTNGVIQGTATLDISHTVVTADGQVNPGNPLGALRILGNLPQSVSGRINVQLGGTSPGVSYDQLIVSGSAALRGALNISLANGFVPSGGDTFEVMDYGASVGSFDSISGLNLASGLYLEPQFNATNLVLVTVDTRPRPRFLQPVPLPGGAFSTTLTGIAGQTFIIQATTNFTAWQPVLTNVNAGATFDFIFDVTNYPRRFFRAAE